MRRPSPALALSLVALFVSLGGTAMAARVLITSSKQLKNGVVTNAKVRKGTLRADRLSAAARAALRGAAGHDGAQGVPGPPGKDGQSGVSFARRTYRTSGPTSVPGNGTYATVATMHALDAGSWVVMATSTVSAGGNITTCRLAVGADSTTSEGFVSAAAYEQQHALLLTTTLSSASDAVLQCKNGAQPWGATATQIVAIKLDTIPAPEVGA
jgi:hypothetical protein